MKLLRFANRWLLSQGLRDMVRNAAPIAVSKIWFGEAPTVLHPESGVEASLLDLQTAPFGEVLWVPINKVRTSHGGLGLTYEQSPFVRYFRDGLPALEKRHELGRLVAGGQFVRPYPWFPPVSRFVATYPDKLRLSWLYAEQQYGAVNDRRLLAEASRLDDVRKSIDRLGFCRFPGGSFIDYYLLIDDVTESEPDFRAVLSGGYHRSAYLAHRGWSKIPMTPQPTGPREIRLSGIRNWPGVLDGSFPEEVAHAFFTRYFQDSSLPLVEKLGR